MSMDAQVSKRCPECGAIFGDSPAVDQHRASEHGVPIFAEFPVACPECSKAFENLNAMSRHRELEHGHPGEVRAERGPIHYESTEDSPRRKRKRRVPAHSAGKRYVHKSQYRTADLEADEPLGFFGWVRGIFNLLLIVGGLLAALAVLGVIMNVAFGFLTGLGEKDTVKEERGNPGYSFVRDLKAEDAIDDFRPVEPDGGWEWQYELDQTTDLRFRTAKPGLSVVRPVGPGVELEVESRRPDLVDAVEREASQRGYETR